MMGSPRTDSALRLIAVTPGRGTAAGVVARAADAMRGGATSIWLRERHRPDHELRDMLELLCDAAEPTGAAIVISGRPDLAEEFGLFGVHLGYRDPRIGTVRPGLKPGIHIGYSAHDPLQTETVRAADYITLSPVHPTRKADREAHASPLGLTRFATLAAGVDRPIVGLGGITVGLAADVIDAGACGVAVMGAVFSAKEAGAAARSLRTEVDQALASRRARSTPDGDQAHRGSEDLR